MIGIDRPSSMLATKPLQATLTGEDAWKAIDIAEVMKKAGSPVPPEMQQAQHGAWHQKKWHG